MPGIALEVDLSPLAALVRQQAQRVQSVDMGKALRDCAVYLSKRAKECFDESRAPDGTPWKPLAHPRPRGGDKPLRDTGKLMASLGAVDPETDHATVERITSNSLTWGTNLDRAWIHQHGDTITPQGHPFLAIPLTPEAARFMAHGGRSPRKFPKPLFIPRRKGGGICRVLAEKKRRGKYKGSLVFHFALVRSVTIPARPFLGLTQTEDEWITNRLSREYLDPGLWA
jgi:phage gpG-like protein